MSAAKVDASVIPYPVDQPPHYETGVAVIRYFLDRGRLAEIRIPKDSEGFRRIPKDLDDREKRSLFAHLRIDLLDEVVQ